MTVLFSDVRDFTSISEGLTPEGLKDLMNTYLTAMTEKVQEKRGTIDKYIGDAIMAFWGAPLHGPRPRHARAGDRASPCRRALRELDAAVRQARLAGAAHRRRPQLRHDERGRHGLAVPPLLHGDGRRGEPRLAPGGPHQGVRRRHPRHREHRRAGAGLRLPRDRQGAREGQARGRGDLRAARARRARWARTTLAGDRPLPEGARRLPRAALGRGREAPQEPRLRRAEVQALQALPRAHRALPRRTRRPRTGTACSSSRPSKPRAPAGTAPFP